MRFFPTASSDSIFTCCSNHFAPTTAAVPARQRTTRPFCYITSTPIGNSQQRRMELNAWTLSQSSGAQEPVASRCAQL